MLQLPSPVVFSEIPRQHTCGGYAFLWSPWSKKRSSSGFSGCICCSCSSMSGNYQVHGLGSTPDSSTFNCVIDIFSSATFQMLLNSNRLTPIGALDLGLDYHYWYYRVRIHFYSWSVIPLPMTNITYISITTHCIGHRSISSLIWGCNWCNLLRLGLELLVLVPVLRVVPEVKIGRVKNFRQLD